MSEDGHPCARFAHPPTSVLAERRAVEATTTLPDTFESLSELTFEEAEAVLRDRGFDPDAVGRTRLTWKDRYRLVRQDATARAIVEEYALWVRWVE